jgi:hypothetical protein
MRVKVGVEKNSTITAAEGRFKFQAGGSPARGRGRSNCFLTAFSQANGGWIRVADCWPNARLRVRRGFRFRQSGSRPPRTR